MSNSSYRWSSFPIPSHFFRGDCSWLWFFSVFSYWRNGLRCSKTTWRELRTTWTVCLRLRSISGNRRATGRRWLRWATSSYYKVWKAGWLWLFWRVWGCRLSIRCWWTCTSWKSWRRRRYCDGSHKEPPQTKANSSAKTRGWVLLGFFIFTIFWVKLFSCFLFNHILRIWASLWFKWYHFFWWLLSYSVLIIIVLV